jgi:hypothetical protein
MAMVMAMGMARATVKDLALVVGFQFELARRQ